MKNEDKMIEELRELSRKMDDLYYSGKKAESNVLLQEALKKAAGNAAYTLFFGGEVECDTCEGGGHLKQEEYFRKAVELRRDDYFLLRSLGTVLSFQGKEKEAIEWFKKALEANDKDYSSLRQIGVSFSKQGKEKEAIEWYERALEVYVKDYNSLRQIGVSFSNQGKRDEAIEWFKKALRVNDMDAQSYRDWSITEFSRAKYDIAFEKIKEAYKLAPERKSVVGELKYICTYLEKDINVVLKELAKDAPAIKTSFLHKRIEQDVPELRGLVKKVRDEFGPSMDAFVEQIKDTEQKRNEFLDNEPTLHEDDSFFLLLRKWNSYTPIIPSDDSEERSIGGGYLISHKGKGTIIDPGYNFIENYYKAGCKIHDIKNIIITHAHNDHTIDFESLMALLYKYNEYNELKPKDKDYKKINVYLNTGSMMKFSGIIDLRGCDYIKKVYTMTAGNKYELSDGMELSVLPAYHDEVVSNKYSVGLHFSIDTKKGKKNLLFTSDTGLFPQTKNIEGKKVADVGEKEIHELYGECSKNVNLLIPHLGSIRKEEINSPIDSDEIFYPNHLGILGTARMITKIRPKLAVVSEFGEELRDFQEKLIKLLDLVVKGFFDKEKKNVPVVLPGDIPLIYDIEKEGIYCLYSKKIVDFKKIKSVLNKKDVFCYHSEDERYSRTTLESKCSDFNKMREERKAPYSLDN